MIELHCHVDGLLDPEMVRELLAEGHELGLTAEALEAVCPVRSMDEWMGAYSTLVAPSLRPTTRMLPMLAAHVRRLARQGVEYAEIMLSGLLDPKADVLPVVDRFRAFREAADVAAAGRLQIEFLVAIGRGPAERTAAQAERILEVAREGLVVGVAIAGIETKCTIASLAPTLDRLRDAGLGIEIHAGEMAGPESVWDALEHGRPDRIGHGVRAFEDERLVAALGERGVHLELCPTSNLRLGVVSDLSLHPIARARELGLSYSVNTDDPGPFGCSMTSEMAMLEVVHGFTAADRATIRDNAWRARFARR